MTNKTVKINLPRATGVRAFFGKCLLVLGAISAMVAAGAVCKADDISDLTGSVSGYVTAAIAVGVAVILFVLGKRVLRKLI
jgi:hypothetical protein